MGLSLCLGLILYALSQNINLFYTPTEIASDMAPMDKTIRVGGMVVDGSFTRGDKLNVEFTLTDFENTLVVQYNGILPDLFREGQGIVAQGVLNANGHFEAKQVLAKHDENYMPPEIAKLKQA